MRTSLPNLLIGVPVLRCTVCDAVYHEPFRKTCKACGPWGVLEYHAEPKAPGPGRGMERFLPVLPLDPSWPRPTPLVGDTPVVEAPRLAAALGLSRLRLKDEGRNPSGSIKDRASWAAAVHSRRRTVACASTGSSAASMATMCASLSSLAVVFVPRDTPGPRVAQSQIFGARVFRVGVSYAEAYALATRAITELGWYDRNAAMNPVLLEGEKTCGLELGEIEAADWVAVGVGDGCSLAGIWKGLKEMHQLGVLSRLPKLIGVQPMEAPAIYEEWRRAGDAGPARPPRPAQASSRTVSMNIAEPRNWRLAVRAVEESGGRMVLVSDADIRRAMALCARLGGVYAEPSGAAAVAGLAKIKPGGSAIAVISDSGMKDPDTALKAGGDPMDIAATIEAIHEAMEASNWGI